MYQFNFTDFFIASVLLWIVFVFLCALIDNRKRHRTNFLAQINDLLVNLDTYSSDDDDVWSEIQSKNLFKGMMYSIQYFKLKPFIKKNQLFQNNTFTRKDLKTLCQEMQLMEKQLEQQKLDKIRKYFARLLKNSKNI